jgi:hypothetical protein
MYSLFSLSPGIEPDAWRVLLAARHIAENHTYIASRLPGFPVPEWIFSLFTAYPTSVVIALTFLVSLGGFISYYRLLGVVGVQERLLLTLAYAFTPVVIINSFTVMDYMWSISFALFSFLLTAKRRYILAGIFLGVATGCRISASLMVLPLCYLIWSSYDDRRTGLYQGLLFFTPAVFVSLLCYLPVFLTYGISFLEKSIGTGAPFLQLARIALIDSLGPIGALVFAGVAVVHLINGNKLKSRKPQAFVQWNRICWMVVTLFAVLYLFLPVKAGYLIPLIPFALLLARIHLSQVSFRILATGLILSSLWLSVDTGDRPWSAPSSPVSMQFVSGGRTVAFDFLNGPLLHDFRKRESQVAYARSVLDWADTQSDSAMLVAGVWMPSLSYLTDQLPDRKGEQHFVTGRVKIVGLVDNKIAGSVRHKNIRLFYLPGQNFYEKEVYGIELEQLGGTELETRGTGLR